MEKLRRAERNWELPGWGFEVLDESLNLAGEADDIRSEFLEGVFINVSTIAGVIELTSDLSGRAFRVAKKLHKLAAPVALNPLRIDTAAFRIWSRRAKSFANAPSLVT